jgi:hypothetical protein
MMTGRAARFVRMPPRNGSHPGQAEVHHARAPCAVENDVRRLQISVHQQLPVRFIQGSSDPQAETLNLG